jgi:hypothetical protein
MSRKGMKKAVPMLNITGLYGDQVQKHEVLDDIHPFFSSPTIIVVPAGKFEGAVLAGKGSQAKIFVSPVVLTFIQLRLLTGAATTGPVHI